jgi:hypothetical protein
LQLRFHQWTFGERVGDTFSTYTTVLYDLNIDQHSSCYSALLNQAMMAKGSWKALITFEALLVQSIEQQIRNFYIAQHYFSNNKIVVVSANSFSSIQLRPPLVLQTTTTKLRDVRLQSAEHYSSCNDYRENQCTPMLNPLKLGTDCTSALLL